MAQREKSEASVFPGTRNSAAAVLESIADGVFTVDLDWNVTSFNRAAEEITGVEKSQALGKKCWEVLRASVCESACVLRKTMDTGRPIVNEPVYIVRSDGRRIPISVSTALLLDDDGEVVGGAETFRDLSVEEELRRELKRRYSFEDMISKHHRLLEVFDTLPDIAESGSTVLITGESGTGKELMARAIHNLSPRSDGPLVIVNCGALPDTLLESELFGHKAGAFTDAKRDRAGRFALAKGGTVFLDEIGDVSPALQSRLLRVLQDGTYEPLGSTRTERTDARVIAATNRDIASMVETGEFRNDLYYRINVITIDIPPLRERREDIPLLVDHFVARFNRLKGKDVTSVSPDAMEILMRHDYPGNVRELENAIEHAFAMSRGRVIRAEHLPQRILPDDVREGERPESFAEAEAAFLRRALEQHDWNRAATARDLGIHKTTLWRKMKRLDIAEPGG
ncbi:MAG: PAS domain-containing protein [Candidatus Eisenbacteria bacterium]|nr:PAS domain-containing protein [Candidatus Eisenbacteria bacterium]